MRKVDRHGFRDVEEKELQDKCKQDSMNKSMRDEYFHKMVEYNRLKKIQEDGADSDEEMSEEGEEEGEFEMEEGEEDMEEMEEEEGEDEFVSDDDDGEIPNAVPIQKGINNQKQEKDSEISDINLDDYGSETSEYDSDELNPDTTANAHGFMFGNMLETFSKSRKDRIE